MMNNILEVRGLRKRYRNFELKDVSFTLPQDCIVGFIGVNGSGKTTTIRTILDLARKDAGDIHVFGQPMKTHESEIKDRMGVVLDEGFLFEGLTMDEMKSIVSPAYSKWNDLEYQHLMKRFALNPKQKIKTLSRGMRIQFALVLALSHKAELLIMDEPTSGLDPLIRSQLLDMLLEFMQNSGKSVFFSSHITSDLDKIADILILIDDGEIIFEKGKDDILDNFRIIKGSNDLLNANNKDLFISLRRTDYGFIGLTDRLHEVQKVMSGIVCEPASIEDIMLAHVEGKGK